MELNTKDLTLLVDKLNEVLSVQDSLKYSKSVSESVDKKLDTVIEKIAEMKVIQMEFSQRLATLEDRTDRHSARQAIYEDKMERVINEIRKTQNSDKIESITKINKEMGVIKDDISNVKIKAAGISGSIAVGFFIFKEMISHWITGAPK